MTETDNVSRRRFLQVTGGAASAVALAGCTGGDGEGDGTATETETETETEETETETESGGSGDGDTLQLINATMSTLDPIKATDTASGTVIQQVYDALMNYPNGEIEVESQLATGHEVSDDFTTYTIELKEGAEYHNGDEVTAQDFVYSWERLAASDNSRRSYFILDKLGVVHETETVEKDGEEKEVYKPESLEVEAVDDYTLEFTLEEPFHAALEMLAYTSFAAVPEGYVGDIDGYDGEVSYDEFSTQNPVGAGPFEFESWESNTEAEVTRFDDYHGETANIESVHWNIMSDEDARYTYGVVNQNADITPIPTSKYDPNKVNVEETDDLGRKVGTYGPTQSDATLDYTGFATVNAFYIGFNTDAVEKPIRQAAAYALNQQEAIEQIFKGRGETSYHFTPPSIYPGGANQYTEHAKNNYPYGYNETQLEQARQVMEEAGYDSNNKAQFTFTVYESSDTWADLGKLLRDKLSSAHIEMSVEKAPFSTLLQRGREGNLEAYSLGWIMDWPAPDNFLQLLNPPQTDTSQAAPVSYVNWSDTDAAQRAEEAWQQVESNTAPTDEAEQARQEAYVEIEEANWEDVGFLPIYHSLGERFWYENVDIEPFGGGGPSRQMYNSVSLE